MSNACYLPANWGKPGCTDVAAPFRDNTGTTATAELPAMETTISPPRTAAPTTDSNMGSWLLLGLVGVGLYIAKNSGKDKGLGCPDDAPAKLAGPPRRKSVPRSEPQPVRRPTKPRTHGQHVARLVIR